MALRPAALCLLTLACDVPQDDGAVRPDDRTLREDAAGAGDFTGSGSCRSCHPDEWDSWHRSYHRTMTQPATAQTVLGDWDEVHLERHGRRYRLYREGERFMVDLPAPGTTGSRPDQRWQLPVEMTTGSHHMQLYWMRMPWAGGDRPAAPLFAERCQGCHAEGRSLVGRGLGRDDILDQLSDPDDDHAIAALLPATQRLELAEHVMALQHTDRIAQLPFAWFIREGRWIHEDDSFLQPPLPAEEEERFTEGWSRGCDRCHSVEPWDHFDGVQGRSDAAVVELGIACEACHGPGLAHAAAHRDPLSRYAAHLGLGDVDDIVQPADLPPDRANGVCGQCHAELEPLDAAALSESFAPGDDLHAVAHVWQWDDDVRAAELPEAARLALEDEPEVLDNAFWADGTVRIAGRDLNGMLATACVTEGTMSCMSCHELHGDDPNDQLRPGASGEGPEGDTVCLDCHPGLDTPEHHHHAVESTGARCVSCHMPHTTIGLLTVMRAHRVDSPSAQVSAVSGRPTACNLCHLDRTLAWTEETLAGWAGRAPALPLASAVPQSLDQALRGDAAQRAVWAWHLGWEPAREAAGDDWPAGVLVELVTDPYVAVRTIARARLREDPRFAEVDWDPALPPGALVPTQERLRARWQRSMEGRSRPEVWLQDGVLERSRVERWLMLRDDREVVVNE